jgi:type IV pilus assembly protein PilE
MEAALKKTISATRRRIAGFTLSELMVVMVVVAILATLAYPAYNRYLLRARVVPAADALTALATRLEQRFQDVGGYGGGSNGNVDGDCGVQISSPANFTITCAASNGGVNFLATATGNGPAAQVIYTIDDAGVRQTVDHPNGGAVAGCWSLRGGSCDS